MIDPALLEILCCPESRQPLALADPALLEELNRRIQAGQVRNRRGDPVTAPLDGGLIRQDGQVLYPIRGRLPILLVDEGIALVEAGASAG